MADIGIDQMEGLTESQRSTLAGLWVRSVRDLLGLLRIDDTSRRIGSLLGLDDAGVRLLRVHAERALGPAVVEAAISPYALPPLGLPLRPPPRKGNRPMREAALRRIPLPASAPSLDQDLPGWISLQDRLPPVRNQGERGACVAFAAVAAREYLRGSQCPLSEQFLYWICKEMDGCPDVEGTWPEMAAAGLEMAGVCEADLWPYNPRLIEGNVGQGPAPDAALSNAWPQRIGGFIELGDDWPPTPLSLVQFLLGFEAGHRRFSSRPVIIGLPVYESWRSAETFRSGKIFRRIGDEPAIGGHAMLIVGYRLDPTVPGGGYFIARNCWGADWAAACPEGAGHALISFQYVVDSLDTMISGTLLFAPEELDSAPPRSADAWMACHIEDARRRSFAALATEFAEVETLDERIAERTYRPDATVERERLIERTRRRLVVGKRSVPFPELPEVGESLRRPFLLAALDRAMEETLAEFAAGRLNFADFLERQSQWLSTEHWIRCFSLDERHTLEGAAAGKVPFRRMFRHLPVYEVALPPLPGIAEAIQQRVGIQVALPEARFRLEDPRDVAGESRPIAVTEWLPVPTEARDELGADTRVGILDSGLDLNHPDFADVNKDDCADFSGEGRMSDEMGHGTHCLAILAGAGNGDARYAGVAPRSGLLVARVFDREGWTSLENILAGLDWIVERGANIVSLSLGSSESPNGRSQLTQVCDYLSERRHMIICVSAGNAGPAHETIAPPADGVHVVSVAALDSARRLAEFSSRGSPRRGHPCFEKPTVAGPGVRVIAARSAQSNLPAVDAGGLYAEMSGTSMAAPAIAGVCSLLWSACSEENPASRRKTVLQALFETAIPPVRPDGKPYDRRCEVGYGVPDVVAALKRLGWSAGASKREETKEMTLPAAPKGAVCSWSGVPLAAGWKLGRDYFRCENPDCRSPESERYVSKAAWESRGAGAAGRRWCKACLSATAAIGTEQKDLASCAAEAMARLWNNAKAALAPKTRLSLRENDGEWRDYRVKKLSHPVTTTLRAPTRFPWDGSAPTVAWFSARLSTARRALIGSGEETVAIVGVASGLNPAELETVLSECWPEAWEGASLAAFGVPVTLNDSTPLAGRTGRCAWYVIPIPRKNGAWHAPTHWPKQLDEALRRCFLFETEEERFKRYRDLILDLARKEWDGTSDLRLDRNAALIELWQPHIILEIGRRFFQNHLAVILDEKGDVACIRLREPSLWLERERGLEKGA